MPLEPTRKAIAVKKFIETFYDNRGIKKIDFDLYTEDVPTVKVYFEQKSDAANESQVFQHEIIWDIKKYLGIKSTPSFLFNWEGRMSENQNPDVRIKVISLNEPI